MKIREKVSEAIKETMDFKKKDKVNVHLIHGITGSGKTEVYMDLIDYTIKKGKSVIVLIPEIALTYQTVMRFTRRFKEKVSNNKIQGCHQESVTTSLKERKMVT